jgi:hypothetical protein
LTRAQVMLVGSGERQIKQKEEEEKENDNTRDDLG